MTSDAAFVLVAPVKLVIWDLDDTFWRGTLSEGPVDLDPDRIELVRALNRRGIVNAICSKNDEAPVRAELEAAGMWDEFVFARIDWTPKGPRVARIIEDAQLRPENVLFVDDRASNLGEAEHYAPGLQTAGPEILGEPARSAPGGREGRPRPDPSAAIPGTGAEAGRPSETRQLPRGLPPIV